MEGYGRLHSAALQKPEGSGHPKQTAGNPVDRRGRPGLFDQFVRLRKVGEVGFNFTGFEPEMSLGNMGEEPVKKEILDQELRLRDVPQQEGPPQIKA